MANETNRDSNIASSIQVVPETTILKPTTPSEVPHANLGNFNQVVRIHSKNEMARRASNGGNYP
jgi:hypothetical protein